jgi:uncharacterized protein YciI
MADTQNRRHFIGMGLAAAGLSVAASSTGAAPESAASGGRTRTYLVVYRAGENWIPGQPVMAQPIKEHGPYMLELYRQGILKQAGPFGDGTGGAAVFEAQDDALARALVEADPAVQKRVFGFDLHPWTLVSWAERVKAGATPEMIQR